jgi:hypothetical protein
MIKDQFKDSIRRWSLERVKFLLSHVEGFIEDDDHELRVSERAKAFVSASGLESIEKLVEAEPSDPHLQGRVLERLVPFFEAGLLLQRGPAQENANWWATDLFWRGSLFHLELKDQVQANRLVPELSPLRVNKASANKTLQLLNLQFMSPGPEADAYLIKPTPTLAYVLVSRLAAPWSVDHISHVQRLINKCFIY